MPFVLRQRTLALLFFAVAIPAHALNPIHDARYQIVQQPPLRDRFDVFGGFATPWDGNLGIPVGVTLGVNEFLEFGARLQYDHYDLPGEDDNRLLLDVGGRVRVSKIEAIQVDLQFGEEWGVTAEYALYTALIRRWSVLWSFRASFFDGLNYGEPVILEGDALHRIRLFKPFDLLLDLSYSTSVISPVDFSAFDLAPGCTVRLANGIRFDMLVTMGVAGRHKEGEFLWKFALTKEM